MSRNLHHFSRACFIGGLYTYRISRFAVFRETRKHPLYTYFVIFINFRVSWYLRQSERNRTKNKRKRAKHSRNLLSLRIENQTVSVLYTYSQSATKAVHHEKNLWRFVKFPTSWRQCAKYEKHREISAVHVSFFAFSQHFALFYDKCTAGLILTSTISNSNDRHTSIETAYAYEKQNKRPAIWRCGDREVSWTDRRRSRTPSQVSCVDRGKLNVRKVKNF